MAEKMAEKVTWAAVVMSALGLASTIFQYCTGTPETDKARANTVKVAEAVNTGVDTMVTLSRRLAYAEGQLDVLRQAHNLKPFLTPFYVDGQQQQPQQIQSEPQPEPQTHLQTQPQQTQHGQQVQQAQQAQQVLDVQKAGLKVDIESLKD